MVLLDGAYNLCRICGWVGGGLELVADLYARQVIISPFSFCQLNPRLDLVGWIQSHFRYASIPPRRVCFVVSGAFGWGVSGLLGLIVANEEGWKWLNVIAQGSLSPRSVRHVDSCLMGIVASGWRLPARWDTCLGTKRAGMV